MQKRYYKGTEELVKKAVEFDYTSQTRPTLEKLGIAVGKNKQWAHRWRETELWNDKLQEIQTENNGLPPLYQRENRNETKIRECFQAFIRELTLSELVSFLYTLEPPTNLYGFDTEIKTKMTHTCRNNGVDISEMLEYINEFVNKLENL